MNIEELIVQNSSSFEGCDNTVLELEENKHKILYIKAKLKSIGDSL